MKIAIPKRISLSLVAISLISTIGYCASTEVPPAPPESNSSQHIWPIQKLNISSGYGPRFGSQHKGVDLAAPPGTPVLASADGVVEFAGWERMGYGYLIIIDHGQGVRTYYAHNRKNLVHVGQPVVQGQRIALVGKTGLALGHHVHFELRINNRPIDPNPYIQTETLAANQSTP